MGHNNLTMARFKYTDNSQGQFIAVNLKEQIALGTFEWVASHIIDKADIPPFEKKHRNDAKGVAACPPASLLKAILSCSSRGIITSRKIERAYRENIVTKALAEDLEPDRDTTDSFISTNNEEVKDLFGQVLFKCGELKLITGEMFATGGCKPPSNASKECSGKTEELVFLETAKPRKGLPGEEAQSNTTDNESGFIKSAKGYIQGYNAVTMADSGSQIIIAAEVTGGVAEGGMFP
jgi:hypothetical protein